MDMGLRRLLLHSDGLLRLGLAPGRQRDLVHELRVLALHQHRGIVGDGLEQERKPGLVGLGEIAEHMRVDQILDPRMADTEPQTAVFLAAMGVDGLDAVVPAVAAAGLDPGLAGGKVQFVIDDDDVLWREL